MGFVVVRLREFEKVVFLINEQIPQLKYGSYYQLAARRQPILIFLAIRKYTRILERLVITLNGLWWWWVNLGLHRLITLYRYELLHCM